jgi:predicted Zn-dependent peptidase
MDPRRTRLDPGAIVVSERVPGAGSVAFGLWFPTGSRHETRLNNGISHFIEHLVFKGTGRRTADEINRELDLLGGVSNAYTSKESLSFHARVLAAQLPRAFDLLADLAANGLPQGLDEPLERERDVILAEISAVEDSPEDLAGDLCDAAFFGEHSLALPVVGCPRAVARMALPELRSHFRSHLVARDLVVAAAGAVDHEALVALARERLAGLPVGEARPDAAPPAPGAACRVAERDFEQAQVCLSAPGVGRRDLRRATAEMLSVIAGEGCSSRLFREVRDRRGLAYSIQSSLATYSDSGSFIVTFGVAPERLEEAFEVVGTVLAELRRDGVSGEELEAARLQLHTSMVLAHETPGGRMSFLADQALAGSERLDLEAALDELAAVEREQVNALARELFSEPLAVAAVGPVDPSRLPRQGWEIPG